MYVFLQNERSSSNVVKRIWSLSGSAAYFSEAWRLRHPFLPLALQSTRRSYLPKLVHRQVTGHTMAVDTDQGCSLEGKSSLEAAVTE
jgi:hypothetical protein